MEKNPRAFKGVWIPEALWLDPELSIVEVCLLTEIDSLDQGEGCFAGNEHFAKFLRGRVSPGQVANIISGLRKKGYIIDRKFDGRKRYISLQENLRPAFRNSLKLPSGKPEHSNTVSNTNTPYNPPGGIGNQEGNELSGINNGDLIPFPSERKNGEAKSNAPKIPDNPASSPKDASLARDCRRIIEHLNTISGKRFSFKSKATQRLVKARLAEDHTVEDFFAVHENKRDWLNDPKWDKYYRPETLYAASHFESYLNEKPAVDPEAWRYGI